MLLQLVDTEQNPTMIVTAIVGLSSLPFASQKNTESPGNQIKTTGYTSRGIVSVSLREEQASVIGFLCASFVAAERMNLCLLVCLRRHCHNQNVDHGEKEGNAPSVMFGAPI